MEEQLMQLHMLENNIQQVQQHIKVLDQQLKELQQVSAGLD